MERTNKDTIPGWTKPATAADYVGTSLRNLRTWLQMGLPHSRVGNRIFINYGELDEWLRQQRVTSVSDTAKELVEDIK
jgi:excisionase family DNA binding protein